MSERYMVTGVQLGMLQALNDKYERAKLIEEIIENQYVGNLCPGCNSEYDEDDEDPDHDSNCEGTMCWCASRRKNR